jgi:hypothetical protein
MNPIKEIKKICRLCGSSDNKFEAKRQQCNKCRYKLKKEKYTIDPNYFKTYYIEHRDEILLQQKEYRESSKLII